MKLKEDEHLDFVLRHYQKGKLDTQKAFRAFRNKYATNISIRPYRYKYAIAAAVILIISLFTGILYKWVQPSADWGTLSSGNQAKEIRLPGQHHRNFSPGLVYPLRSKYISGQTRCRNAG